MKQKTMKLIAAVILGGVVLLTAGCMKESEINELYRPAGTPIAISAATGYENGSGTRTEYSGQLYGDSPKYERIDWVSEDPIAIAYVHGTQSVASQYAVTEVNSSTDKTSTASIEVMDGQTKLTWGEGSGDHTFYAMYPSNGFGDNTSASLTNNNHVQGSIPATQTPHVKDGKYLPPMQYGYMVAYKQIASGSTESRVTLPFAPAMTAFEFKLQRASGDVGTLKVTGVELEATTPLTGTFAFNITGGDENGAVWNKTTTGANPTVLTGTGNKITMTFPVTGGVSLPEYGSDTFLDFTLFGLPVEQTGLTLKLIYSGGSFKTLTLNDSGDIPHVFAAAKKYVITNKAVPGSSFEYVLQPTGTTITLTDGTTAEVVSRDLFTAGDTNLAPFESYKTTDGGTTKTPVDVEVFEYGTENTDGTISWSSAVPDGLVAVVLSGTGVEKTLKAQLSVNRDVDYYLTPFIDISRSLKQRSPAVDLDLSLYEAGKLVTPRAGNKRVTANTYIIDRPGTFKFPLVYGNAVDWTRTEVVNGVDPQLTGCNVYAYSDGTGRSIQTDFWPDFYRFDGRKIQSPYILADLGLSSADVEAVVVWEDVESAEYSMLTIQQSISDETVSGFCDLDGTALGTVPYIRFTIPQGSIIEDEKMYPFHRVTGIREGNIVVALRTNKEVTVAGESFPAHTLLWDWHIWISDQDMTPVNFHTRPPYNTVTDSNDILPIHNGFTRSDTHIYFAERTIYAKLRQVDGDITAASPIVFKIVQANKGNSYRSYSATGNQTGRHTPNVPVIAYWDEEYPTSDHYKFIFKEAYSPSGYPLASPDYPRQTETFNGIMGNCRLPFGWISSLRTTFQNPTGVWLGTYPGVCPYPVDESHQGPIWNLWNMIETGGHTDKRVFKTVYDPCPPGYCVPHLDAFSNLVKSGGNYVQITNLSEFNVKDMNGDGSITSADFWADPLYAWNFFTGNGDETISFPLFVRPSSWGASYSSETPTQPVDMNKPLNVSNAGMFWTAGNYPGGNGTSLVYVSVTSNNITTGKRTGPQLSGIIHSFKELD